MRNEVITRLSGASSQLHQVKGMLETVRLFPRGALVPATVSVGASKSAVSFDREELIAALERTEGEARSYLDAAMKACQEEMAEETRP